MTNREAGRLFVVGWAAATVLCVYAAVLTYHENFACALCMLLAAAAAVCGSVWNFLHFWSVRREG